MKNDAINEPVLEDVSADDAAGEMETGESTEVVEKPAETREPTDREKRLSEIARQNAERDGYLAPEKEPEAQADPEAQEEQETRSEEAQSNPFEELGYYRKDDGKLYAKMKINGQEREVPADQIKAYLQKDLAGDYKLQQAAQREQQLQEMERRLRDRESQLQQSMSKQQPPKLGAEESRQQAKTVLQKIYDGEDDAAEALTEFLRSTNSVDAEQLLAQAEQRAMTALEQREVEKQRKVWQKSVDEGNQWLASEHADIYADQRLFDLVNGETARLVEAQQRGDPELANLTPRQIIERAAVDVRAWMDGSKEKPKGPTQEARAERKANLKPIPRGMSRQPTREAPKPAIDTSPAAVVERMRRARAV